MNIKTSPISDSTSDITYSKILGKRTGQYSLPQTNILLGFVMRHKGFRWQFYFEEDAITNQGTDITFNVTFSHTINLKLRK
jgi:hypothetical protein